MLHLITPLYRYHFLEQLYSSIPPYEDIHWHLSISNKRDAPKNEFLYVDRRITLYQLDCEDDDLVYKRNYVFNHVRDGYFFLLDDDTLFFKKAYDVYSRFSSKHFVGMIIGRQDRKFYIGRACPPFTDAKRNSIDTGMVIAHSSVLRQIQWAWTDLYSRDLYFWSKCYGYFGVNHTIVLNDVISGYNLLSSGFLMRTKKKILGIEIYFEIYNPNSAKVYLFLKVALGLING